MRMQNDYTWGSTGTSAGSSYGTSTATMGSVLSAIQQLIDQTAALQGQINVLCMENNRIKEEIKKLYYA